MWYHAVPYRAMSKGTMLCHAAPRHAVQYCAMTCSIVPCHAVSCPAMQCCTVPRVSTPCNAEPRCAVPRHAVPGYAPPGGPSLPSSGSSSRCSGSIRRVSTRGTIRGSCLTVISWVLQFPRALRWTKRAEEKRGSAAGITHGAELPDSSCSEICVHIIIYFFFFISKQEIGQMDSSNGWVLLLRMTAKALGQICP